MQEVEPDRAKLFTGQLVHMTVPELYMVPAGQVVQLALPDLLKDPEGQAEHEVAPSDANWLAAHAVH